MGEGGPSKLGFTGWGEILDLPILGEGKGFSRPNKDKQRVKFLVSPQGQNDLY